MTNVAKLFDFFETKSRNFLETYLIDNLIYDKLSIKYAVSLLFLIVLSFIFLIQLYILY